MASISALQKKGRPPMLRRLMPGIAVCLGILPALLWADVPGLQKPDFDSNGVKIHWA